MGGRSRRPIGADGRTGGANRAAAVRGAAKAGGMLRTATSDAICAQAQPQLGPSQQVSGNGVFSAEAVAS